MSVVKILLVEDESIEAMDIKRTLESFGYQVPYVASRGEEAIKKALELMPDLILMDIILKGEINGIEAVSEINKLNIPVIYLTAHSEESTIERAKLTMPYGYILKPYDAVELKYAVELALYKNKMEKELKESGKKFHLLFDNSPLPYQSLDENGFFLDVNQVWLDCLGYSKDEVIGKNFAQFLAPGYTEQFKKNFPIFKSAGEIHDVEFEMKHKDGSHIFVSFEGKIGYDELGRFKQTHCIFQDISQRIKAEKNLKESETYYKALFEHSGVATVIIDENTTISLANTEFEKLSGYKRGEIEGKMSWTEFVVKEDLEKMKERHNLRRTDISAVPTRYEFKFIDRGGNIKDIQLEADMIPGTKKSSAFLLDITEAKKAEKQLLKSQKHLKKRDEEFKHFIDSAPVAIAMFDTQMRYIAVSNRWIEDYNFQGQELTGKSHYDVFPEITDELKEVHKRALAGSIVSADDDKFVRADGSIQYVKWEVQPWYTSPAEIGGIIIFSEDITERVKAENEVKKSEKRLEMGMSIANLAYWEYDVKSDMFTFNDQFYSLYGTSKQQEGSYQMSSQEYTKRFIPPEESPIVAKEVAKALKTDDPDYFATVQHRIIRPDGKERFMLIRIVVVKDEKGQTIRTMGVNQDITEFKLIEGDLAISERRYRALFENSGTPILAFNNNGIILMVNSEWERISGYSREEVEGKMNWMDFAHPDYRTKMMEYHQQRLKEPDSVPNKYEAVFMNKTGVKLTMYVTVVELPGTDWWLASALDITDLKNTQKALEKNVLRFRALAENAIEGIITTDAHGNILYFNHSLMEMFGYTSDELEGIKLAKLMPERYRRKFLEILKKFRTTGEHSLVGRTTETTGLKKDDTEFPFEMSLTKWEIDEEIYFTSIIRDITERKKGEELREKGEELRKRGEKALRDSEKKYRTLFEADPDYTILLRSDGHLADVNQAAIDITGLTRDELVGKSFTDLKIFPEEELQLNIKRFPGLAKSKKLTPFESKIYDANGEIRFIEVKQTFIELDEKIEYILLICSDITQRKKAEDEIKSSLKEKEVLLQEVHHRVKNNMQIISSLLNLQKQYVDDKEAVNVLMESQNRVKSMAMIHEKLYKSEDLVHIEISEYIENLVNGLFYSYAVEMGVITPILELESITLNMETAVPLGLIVSEIVSNSLKYGFPDERKGKIWVYLKKRGDEYILTVGDNGVGFPEGFDFKNTETLGLQLVNNLVNQLDGEITLDTHNGTLFEIQFKELKYKDRI